MGLFYDGLQAVVSEHFFFVVLHVGDAVAEEDDGVAGLCGEPEFFVFDIWEEAEGEAFGFDGFYFASAADRPRLRGSGVGDLERAVIVVPDRVEHDDVLGVELALLQRIVERVE